MARISTMKQGRFRLHLDWNGPDQFLIQLTQPGGGMAIELSDSQATTLARLILDRTDAPKPPEDDPLRFEHETCGTRHLVAERVLRIVEGAVRVANPLPDRGDLQTLVDLATDAGVHLARKSLGEPALDQEIPF